MTMWVFGYGSLVWNPGFDVQDKVIATLPGYHRSFCMRSIHHRGTEEAPGLVLALDKTQDAQCLGLGMSVMAGQEDDVLAGSAVRYKDPYTPVCYESHREGVAR